MERNMLSNESKDMSAFAIFQTTFEEYQSSVPTCCNRDAHQIVDTGREEVDVNSTHCHFWQLDGIENIKQVILEMHQ